MTKSYNVFHNKAANRFEIDLGNGQIAQVIYMIKADLFIPMHTEVPQPFEGRGIAGQLAKTALDYARDEGLKVRSYCSYITRYVERNPEYQDLLG